MSGAAVMEKLRRLNISVVLDEDDLLIRAPRATWTPELRTEVGNNKPFIIALLKDASRNDLGDLLMMARQVQRRLVRLHKSVRLDSKREAKSAPLLLEFDFIERLLRTNHRYVRCINFPARCRTDIATLDCTACIERGAGG